MQNDKEKKNDRNFYVDHLIRGYYSANFNYDRSVMTMAGGALTVFVVFIDKIVDMNSVQWFPLINSEVQHFQQKMMLSVLGKRLYSPAPDYQDIWMALAEGRA